MGELVAGKRDCRERDRLIDRIGSSTCHRSVCTVVDRGDQCPDLPERGGIGAPFKGMVIVLEAEILPSLHLEIISVFAVAEMVVVLW